jgi:hypothetical protein
MLGRRARGTLKERESSSENAGADAGSAPTAGGLPGYDVACPSGIIPPPPNSPALARRTRRRARNTRSSWDQGGDGDDTDADAKSKLRVELQPPSANASASASSAGPSIPPRTSGAGPAPSVGAGSSAAAAGTIEYDKEKEKDNLPMPPSGLESGSNSAHARSHPSHVRTGISNVKFLRTPPPCAQAVRLVAALWHPPLPPQHSVSPVVV